MKKLTKAQASEAVNTFINVCAESSERRYSEAEKLIAQYQKNGDTDLAKAAKTLQTHALKDLELSKLDVETLETVVRNFRNLTAAELVDDKSRELKKRFITFVTAIAKNDKSKLDKPLQELLAHHFATDTVKYDDETVRVIVGHATRTQAGYMRTFFGVIGVAANSEKEKQSIFNSENEIYKLMSEMYA